MPVALHDEIAHPDHFHITECGGATNEYGQRLQDHGKWPVALHDTEIEPPVCGNRLRCETESAAVEPGISKYQHERLNPPNDAVVPQLNVYAAIERSGGKHDERVRQYAEAAFEPFQPS